MDSDYDDDDSSVYGQTTVSLGFPDDQPCNLRDLHILDNHIGGLPGWFGKDVPAEILNATKCLNCHTLMPLIIQISAPLSSEDYERCIYVFACGNPECRRKNGSIRAVRSIMRNEQNEAISKGGDLASPKKNTNKKEMPEENLFVNSSDQQSVANPFGAGNPFESSSSVIFDEKPLKTRETAQKIFAIDDGISGSIENIGRSEYPCYLLEVDIEELKAPKLDPETMKRVITEDEESGPSSDQDNVKMIESSRFVDQTFQKFVLVVESNPDQVIRYQRPLEPLLYSDDKVLSQIPNDKQLELQIMPHTIMLLESENDIATGMEWGTIFVATSIDDLDVKLDSHGIGFMEEWVAVQWEEEVTV